MKIAFIGKPGAGKDTCAEFLQEIYGGTIVKFAKPVYDICAYIQTALGKPVVKDRPLLRMVGEGVKQVYGYDSWLPVAETTIDNTDGNIYISDLRFKNELSIVLKRGFTTVRVIRDCANDSYYTETELDDYIPDHTIYNTTIKSLQHQLIKKLKL